jgi:hypothetical protein
MICIWTLDADADAYALGITTIFQERAILLHISIFIG